MEYKFEVAKKALDIISACNGSVYGNFVRDVIVPRIYDSKCEISFDNINVLFNNRSDKNFAIKMLEEKFTCEFEYGNFLDFTYKICENNKFLFYININVSENHTDQKFDIDYIRYNYSRGSFNCVSFEYLIDR